MYWDILLTIFLFGHYNVFQRKYYFRRKLRLQIEGSKIKDCHIETSLL